MRKTISLIMAILLVLMLVPLTGCGKDNNTVIDNDPKYDPYIEDNTSNRQENTMQPSSSLADLPQTNKQKVVPNADGFYTYTICNGFAELHIKTNVWDYIDSNNVWDATRMAADLGFTTPTYSQGKYLNGFESSDGIYKVLIWQKHENSANENRVFASNHFQLTYGSNRFDDGPVNLNGECISVDSEEIYNTKSMYAIDTAVLLGATMIGTTFDFIVLTAAAMEECNGMIDVSTITNAFGMFKDNRAPGYYVIP